MFTKESIIDLSDLKLITNSNVIRTDPLIIELNDEQMILELKSTKSGFEWTDDNYIILDCLTEMNSKVDLKIKFYNNDEMIWMGYYLVPNRRVKMAIKLDELESKRWFLQTYPGSFKGHVMGRPTHISKIDSVRIFIEKGRDNKKFKLYNMYISDKLPDFTVIGKPLVDDMGQCIEMDWIGKTRTTEDLITFLKQELKTADVNSTYMNKSWSQYGGWKEKQFDKTGYFHTHHDGKRWWLVDPDGYAFFSNGVCYGSRMGVHGFIDGMENLFNWLPAKEDALFKDAWTTADKIPEFVKRNGIEAGRGRYMFNFARANMIRAFGNDWWDSWNKINVSRLKQWGFNTISVCVNNYQDENVLKYLEKAKMPFTWTLKEFPKTDTMIFRDFPDVFDPEYKKRSEIFAEQLKPFVGNPYMIGYFINNEPEWLVQHNVNPAERLLANSNRLYSKIELVEFLKKKYSEDLRKFNLVWNLTLTSFDDLYIPIQNADKLSPIAEKNLLEFRNILIEKYGDIPNNALKSVDPDHMSLGMRYATITEDDFAGAGLYDMFSFNCYQRSPKEKFDLALKSTQKPIIVGEWHIGGSDKGLYSNALVSSSSQAERGKCCSYYMQTAMSYTNCIGIHYFELNDQPLLGRFDGENMQHGLIDICNRPHYACIEKMQETNIKMYELVNGNIKPTNETGVYVDRY